MAEGGAIEDVLRDLARESGRMLAELGVRHSDEKWIREHARAIASLKGKGPGGLLGWLRRRVFRR